jgi:hypothetical protein
MWNLSQGTTKTDCMPNTPETEWTLSPEEAIDMAAGR